MNFPTDHLSNSVSVQSLSHVWLFVTPWTAAHQASLSITNSRSLLKLMSNESTMPSSHLILCHPLLFPLPIPPSIRVFSNESTLHMRWPKYWSFSFSIIPSKEHPGLRKALAAAAAKSLQSCPTLCDPTDGSHQVPPSLGFSRQEHWSGLPFPSPMQESEK